MTGLRPALAGYLDLRRGLGFKLARDEKLLEQFIGWLEDRGTTTVTVADALAWAHAACLRAAPAGCGCGSPWSAASPPTWPRSTRLPRFRRPSLLPGGSHRAVPYLYPPRTSPR